MQKPTKTILLAAILGASALTLSACDNKGSAQNTAQNADNAAPNANDAMGNTADKMADSTDNAGAATYGSATTNWFGGPIYNGAPTLEATAALVKAGGGASNFSFATALVSILGEDTVNAEVAKLTKQYGEEDVNNFIAGMTFDVKQGLKRATEAGVKLPEAPADLEGASLAKTLVQAGTAPDGKFWSGYLFDHALSHPIHVKTMADVDAKDGHAADMKVHYILNQAMYDVAQALGLNDVKLATVSFPEGN